MTARENRPSEERPGCSAGWCVDRRELLLRALGTGALLLPGSSLVAACGGRGPMDERQPPEWMMSGDGAMGREMMEEMRVIHRLLDGHRQIDRRVHDIPGGVRARTTSTQPELSSLIQTHVDQMKARIDSGDPIRRMDPLFREIFEHHDAIELEVNRLPAGVVAIETSDDPQVELLIRQHARRAVSEFVAHGMSRAMEPTPLPPNYRS